MKNKRSTQDIKTRTPVEILTSDTGAADSKCRITLCQRNIKFYSKGLFISVFLLNTSRPAFSKNYKI